MSIFPSCRSRQWPLFLLLLLFSLFSSAANAAQIIRGPYLQQAADTRMIVRWRTDEPSSGTLYLGSSPGAIERAVSERGKTTEHELLITGLAPASRYYYSIHDDEGELVGGSQFFFDTSPSPGTAVETRIWVLGDPGDQSGEEARAVRDAYLGYAGNKRTDFLLLLGDNAYGSGLDRQYQVAVFDRFKNVLRNTPVWSVIGNHESNKPGTRENSSDSVYQTGPYYDMFSFPKNGEAGGVASGTEAYYSFDYGNVHVIVLDSYFGVDRREGFREEMVAWLKSDLANNSAKWTIASWHHSPYSKGSHDADYGSIETHMRSVIGPILESHGVDLVLTGHSHAYERSGLLHGLYEKSAALANHPEYLLDRGNGRAPGDLVIDGETSDGAYVKGSDGKGTVYVVAGNASSVSSKGRLDHPAMVVSRRELGSLEIEILDNHLSVTMINDPGEIRDRFSIVKGEQASAEASASGGSGPAAPAPADEVQHDPDEQAGAEGIGNTPDIVTGGTSAAAEVEPSAGDPVSRIVERQISDGSNDVEEREWGPMSFASTDLEMVNDKWDQKIGLRFNKLKLPVGAKVRRAWIQFEVDEVNTRETELFIHGERTAYSKKFLDRKWNISNREKTARYVSWMPEPWREVDARGERQRSPDLATVIQEIVDNTDWKSGNAMTFIISGHGKRVARAFEGGADSAPVLHIEYE